MTPYELPSRGSDSGVVATGDTVYLAPFNVFGSRPTGSASGVTSTPTLIGPTQTSGGSSSSGTTATATPPASSATPNTDKIDAWNKCMAAAIDKNYSQTVNTKINYETMRHSSYLSFHHDRIAKMGAIGVGSVRIERDIVLGYASGNVTSVYSIKVATRMAMSAAKIKRAGKIGGFAGSITYTMAAPTIYGEDTDASEYAFGLAADFTEDLIQHDYGFIGAAASAFQMGSEINGGHTLFGNEALNAHLAELNELEGKSLKNMQNQFELEKSACDELLR